MEREREQNRRCWENRERQWSRERNVIKERKDKAESTGEWWMGNKHKLKQACISLCTRMFISDSCSAVHISVCASMCVCVCLFSFFLSFLSVLFFMLIFIILCLHFSKGSVINVWKEKKGIIHETIKERKIKHKIENLMKNWKENTVLLPEF